MNRNKYTSHILVFILVSSLISCKKEEETSPSEDNNGQRKTTPYVLEIPKGFPSLDVDLTQEGVQLGRMLFYDPILSKDSSLACAGCHLQQFGFIDEGKKFSLGVDQAEGTRNSMPLFNLVYHSSFFWDGRSSSLEEQALDPVPNPIEMNLSWDEAEIRLNRHPTYPGLFKQAFGTKAITRELVSEAIAQFETILISGNSRYDKAIQGELFLTDAESNGLEIFNTEPRTKPSDKPGGDCFHCHSPGNNLFMDGLFRNNGLDSELTDLGRGAITNQSEDNGKFKTPSLRNVEYTAPYMHDGRFETLEEVIEFYDHGIQINSPNIDPTMTKNGGIGSGLQLTEQEKKDLIAFLKALSDPDFIKNEAFSNPF